MDIIVWVIIITAVAGIFGTGLGGVVSAMFKRDSRKTVSLLLSFAAGIMLAVVCFDLIIDAITPEEGAKTSIFIVILGIVFGYFCVYLLNTWIDKKTNHEIEHIDKDHPQTADDLDELIHADHLEAHKQSNSSLFIAGVVMACAIALHNLPEGMVIGASFAADPSQLFGGSGFILAVIIGLHNIPEGMAISVPLMSGGMSKPKAILITALSGAPTVLGALLGYLIGTVGPLALTISLAFASGAMIYVVLGELLPESILMWRSKLPATATLLGMMVGLIVIYI